MMRADIADLRARAEEIVCAVAERGESYAITYRGQPIGLLKPPSSTLVEEVTAIDERSEWDELTRIGQEIARVWKSKLSPMDILSCGREWGLAARETRQHAREVCRDCPPC